YAEAAALFNINYFHYRSNLTDKDDAERWLRAGLQWTDMEIRQGNVEKAGKLLVDMEKHFDTISFYNEYSSEYFESKLLLLSTKQKYARATRNLEAERRFESDFHRIQDSLANAETIRLREDLNLLREIGLINAENVLAQEQRMSAIERENMSLELRRKSTRIYWLLALGILLAIIVFGFLYFQKNKRFLEHRRNLQTAYSQDLIKTQETERLRLARELHDSVGQKLMLLTKQAKDKQEKGILGLADSTLDEIRSISRGLHPSNLHRLGLTAAIRSMVNELDESTNILFTHEIDDINGLLSKESELQLYRMVQEVLTNAVKHANAKSIRINVTRTMELIQIMVADNGIGFQFEDARIDADGLGLKTLFERAKMVGATVKFESALGNGTIVSINCPISNKTIKIVV
ncbi:MAG: sensor histidine kinase, partial [Bacteroidota bacterium]